MAKIDAFFRLMNSQGASDLHIMAGGSPCLRIHGDVEPIKGQLARAHALVV